MPVIHRQRLAARLRQNWSAMHPTEATYTNMFQMVDDSLTSLAWLQNLNVMKLSSANSRSSSLPATPTIVADEQPRSEMVANHGRSLSQESTLSRLQVDPNDILDTSGKQDNVPSLGPTSAASNGFSDAAAFDEAASAACHLEKDRYRYDTSIKPPYSYATLICMAMQDTPDRRITLSQIYSWISENFAYYKQADQNWQHSIRHNLSLNKCFQKVPRGKDEPGKGGFWTINQDFNSLVDRGIFKKKRLSASSEFCNAGPLHITKKEPTETESLPSSRNRQAPAPHASTSKTGERGSSAGLEVKTSDPILDFRTDTLSDVLDLHWALNQDIDIGGFFVKTEDIIDMHATATPAMVISNGLESPPPSDSDSELELSSLLNFSAFPSGSSLVDPTARGGGGDDALDLTVHGVGLPPPDWWSESLNGHFQMIEEATDLFSNVHRNDGRMNIPSLTRFDDDSFHPWAENRDPEINDGLLEFDASSALLETANLGVTDSFKLF